MQANKCFVVSAVLALGAIHDAKADSFVYDGSDTLIKVTDWLVNLSGTDCGDIEYLGLGSSSGEKAMCRGDQETAPMSRALGASRVCDPSKCDPALVTDPQSRHVGWDGLAVARHRPSTDLCGDLGVDWQTTLRTIYGGTDGSGSLAACDARVRHDLLDNYAAVFGRDGQGCGDDECEEIRHAFRRGENSGTTGVFKSLVGITNFCNVKVDTNPEPDDATLNDNQDNDPVRRCCADDANERYCPGNPDYDPYVMPDGSTCARTLGVVLPIDVPSTSNEDLFAAAVNNEPCATGRFQWALPFPGQSTCPTGSPKVGGLCRYPLDSNDEFGCNNKKNGRPVGVPFSWDGRSYNSTPRYSDGRIVYNPITDRSEFWRLALGCEFGSSTNQIGCLVAAQDCSIGWAGREMLVENADSQAVTIEGADPTNNADILDQSYPLARKLYFNTLNGFSPVDVEEQKLEACYDDPGLVHQAMIYAGYIPLSATDPLLATPLSCN